MQRHIVALSHYHCCQTQQQCVTCIVDLYVTVNHVNFATMVPATLYIKKPFRWKRNDEFTLILCINLLKPTGYVMHHQFNIQ